ncbi:hypothetical protein ACFSKU_16635 [Pontibacter silvestris]|uniref:Quercetin 2,3-dioxygenase C-terminal cupin domain-containing protein n=1 Tax=Pontibacter silvestris TaxID=2305183 RepID=A0ABW4X1I0_9BACT|nr:hypothetical protein [Pontibacter silvestris]MCC9136100.1 hypothetical protein [Pontibacter silvestris]
MIKQVPGRIYLADQRGITETALFRRRCTFNFGKFQNEHKVPFGNLHVLNEETLAGSQRVDFEVEQDSHVIIIPVTGAVDFVVSGNILTVDVEEILVCHLPAMSSFCLTNPYQNNTDTFLQLWIKAALPISSPAHQHFVFDFNSIENKLAKIIPEEADSQYRLPLSLSIGRFTGRHEAMYSLKSTHSLFYAYAIAGVFEMEGRLLHEGDGLALWGTDNVELEALSNNALILTLELQESNS